MNTAKKRLGRPPRPPRERFDKYISPCPNTGCWLWSSGKCSGGYGVFNIGGRSIPAHRAAHEFYKGPIPAGMMVLHRCDVRLCVNPDHLFLGTNDDNMADMVAKGRSPSRERNPKAKLTEGSVAEIRRRLAGPHVVRAMAREFGVRPAVIRNIRDGRHWRERHASNHSPPPSAGDGGSEI